MVVMRRRSIGQLFLVVALVLIILSSWQIWTTRSAYAPRILSDPPRNSHLACWNLPGAQDTVVVLKTGATELLDKLPVHLDTTTRCYPNYAVHSDYGEYYHDQPIIDPLDSVRADIREQHPDFEIYRRLKQVGRSALLNGAFEGGTSETKVTGNAGNPGWKLDKWKFLPMVNRTLFDFPDVKWYVFAEADTYIVWSSMLQLLSTMDPNALTYTGMYMSIGPDVFAYGGAGYVISQPAMVAFANHYAVHQRELEDFIDHHWAGDCALGKAMADAGVHFTNSWPVMQSDYPGWLTYDMADGRSMTEAIATLWCTPVATFHHVSPDAVRGLWDVEQEWIAQSRNTTDGYIRQQDVFDIYVKLQMANPPRVDWDNDSDQDRPEARSTEECHQLCQDNSRCLQYSFEEENSKCRLRDNPRLGRSKAGFRSGWLMDRVEGFRASMPDCSNSHWPV